MRSKLDAVVSLRQAVEAGFTRSAIEENCRTGRWQRPYKGVYVTHNGPVSRPLRRNAVLMAAGRGAVLSHFTAAEVAGLTDVVVPTVHVTVPSDRRVRRPNGATVHYSERIEQIRHPTKMPPQTRIEDTVLDLVQASAHPDEAIGWLSAAFQRRLTTPARLTSAMHLRKRCRWRQQVEHALSDVKDGNHSVLEIRYFRKVEKPHGLPRGVRQAPHPRLGGTIYDDVWYAEFHTVVELDGRATHAGLEFRDLERDNVAGLRGDVVLHYGWTAIAHSPCTVAAQVATALRHAGWTGRLRRCGPECMILKT